MAAEAVALRGCGAFIEGSVSSGRGPWETDTGTLPWPTSEESSARAVGELCGSSRRSLKRGASCEVLRGTLCSVAPAMGERERLRFLAMEGIARRKKIRWILTG